MIPDNTYLCPRCQLPLKQIKMEHGIFWGCEACGGRAVTVELLRRTFTPESINPLWIHAISGAGLSGCGCPLCKRPMIQVTLADGTEVRVDVCKLCHFVWFDAHEVDSLVPKPLPDPQHPSREERERLIAERVKRFGERVDHYQFTRTSASASWQAISDIFFGWH